MKLRFEPRLMQAWVLDEARQDVAFRERCRQVLEPIYALPEGARAEAFAHAYGQLFEERKQGDQVELVLREFPSLPASISEILVWQALSRREEQVELSADRTRIGLSLRLQRLADPTQLAPFLRHELLRIADLLDEGFRYRPERLGSSPAEEGVIRERYRTLWDVSIDSRLSRSGQVAEASREERFREFERRLPFLPVRERRAAFGALWQAEGVTHDRLLRWAQSPTLLLEELAWPEGVEGEPRAPIPGSLCPLCRFPTYSWATPAPEVVALAQADFPGWTPEEGLCERCGECYRGLVVRTALWPYFALGQSE